MFYDSNLKSFGNSWDNSYIKFAILDIKVRFTFGESDLYYKVIIFMFNISFKNVSYVFVKIVQRGATIYETIGRIGTPGLCIFG